MRTRCRPRQIEAMPQGSVDRALSAPGDLTRRPGRPSQGYTGAVPDGATDNGFRRPRRSTSTLFAALRRRSVAPGPIRGHLEADDRLAARAEAERSGPCRPTVPSASARRPGRAPHVKAVLKKMMLVRGAARVRPAVVQRRRAPADRRPRAARRAARGRAGASPLRGEALVPLQAMPSDPSPAMSGAASSSVAPIVGRGLPASSHGLHLARTWRIT